ncbi:MAG: hypothetical protein PUB18_01230 [bacterium]|nr:hypothetical protein [bacterium]
MKWDEIELEAIKKVTKEEFIEAVQKEDLDVYTRLEINPTNYNVDNMVGIINNQDGSVSIVISGERGGYNINNYSTPEEAYGAALKTLRNRKKLSISVGNPGYYKKRF